MDKANAAARFQSFKEFYPFYLQEHANSTCRRLHFIGSTLVLLIIIIAAVRGNYGLLWFVPLAGYGFAWIGHFFFEHNRPATFKYPLYSLLGDWVMYRDMLAGRVRF
ncbi:DUF962 domain-containing protein [Pseudoduganella aquatica]|uniref:DUF962 domain-containing protein n=1 Tax=Pseudoduganella aquatica TaxID=2660641 RepID=A0A7X4HA80_9BURK|nr:DUF962 domain-containing protein [Pseudoduganella aquatica]MYN07129.1 DUF962 domain-containing protein [Pseudoduganella aquatica]